MCNVFVKGDPVLTMAIFLVDLEFREKARNLLTSKEVAACVIFLLFALIPWVEVQTIIFKYPTLPLLTPALTPCFAHKLWLCGY